MKWMQFGLGVVVGVSLVTGLAARSAEACSRPRCLSDVLVPLGESGGRATIPANLPALGWGFVTAGRAVAGGDIQLRRMGTSTAVVPTTFAPFQGHNQVLAIRPSAPWVEGAEYIFSVSPRCESPSAAATSLTLTVGPAVPLPTRLGTLTMGALQLRNAHVLPDGYDGSCATPADIASREANLDLDPQTEPWSSHLLVELLVDGQPRGALRTGEDVPVPTRFSYEGPDRLPYALCRGPETARPYALSEGSHRFQYRAWVIGSDTALLSNEVTADLDCGGEDGGCSTTPRASRASVTMGALAALGAAIALRARRRRRG